MKDANACIKCGHETIWKVDPLSFFDKGYSNVILPLPVACRMIDNPDPGFLGSPSVRKAVGKFVAYVCAKCGYSELYATNIEELGALERGDNGSQVTKLEGRSE